MSVTNVGSTTMLCLPTQFRFLLTNAPKQLLSTVYTTSFFFLPCKQYTTWPSSKLLRHEKQWDTRSWSLACVTLWAPLGAFSRIQMQPAQTWNETSQKEAPQDIIPRDVHLRNGAKRARNKPKYCAEKKKKKKQVSLCVHKNGERFLQLTKETWSLEKTQCSDDSC